MLLGIENMQAGATAHSTSGFLNLAGGNAKRSAASGAAGHQIAHAGCKSSKVPTSPACRHVRSVAIKRQRVNADGTKVPIIPTPCLCLAEVLTLGRRQSYPFFFLRHRIKIESFTIGGHYHLGLIGQYARQAEPSAGTGKLSQHGR